MDTINVNGIIIDPTRLEPGVLKELKMKMALETDADRPAHSTTRKWIGPNFPLFPNSEKYDDVFLTFYRFRNAHEELIHKLEENQDVTEDRDLALVNRLFEMSFYPLKHLSLTQHQVGQDPRVRMVRAYKAKNEKSSPKRPFEISVELTNGKTVQLHINDIISRFMDIKENFTSLMDSDL
jgi:hypothetical protein